ncbi:hypothetical protein AALA78_05465 [Lachnospiraceae bacterium 42-17]
MSDSHGTASGRDTLINYYLFSERKRLALARSVKRYCFSVQTLIIPDVTRVLEQMEGVISGDDIILNRCNSWLNVMPLAIGRMGHIWKIRL